VSVYIKSITVCIGAFTVTTKTS